MRFCHNVNWWKFPDNIRKTVNCKNDVFYKFQMKIWFKLTNFWQCFATKKDLILEVATFWEKLSFSGQLIQQTTALDFTNDNHLYAEVKFSSPRSSTRTIVFSMKNDVKNPYSATTTAKCSYEVHRGRKHTVAPLSKI